MADIVDGEDGTGGSKYGSARAMVEAALRARREGEDDRADELMAQAARVDPQAVESLLLELEPHALSPDLPDLVDGDASDAEVAAMSRTIEPHSAAPPRAGITGSGSGADGQGHSKMFPE